MTNNQVRVRNGKMATPFGAVRSHIVCFAHRVISLGEKNGNGPLALDNNTLLLSNNLFRRFFRPALGSSEKTAFFGCAQTTYGGKDLLFDCARNGHKCRRDLRGCTLPSPPSPLGAWAWYAAILPITLRAASLWRELEGSGRELEGGSVECREGRWMGSRLCLKYFISPRDQWRSNASHLKYK